MQMRSRCRNPKVDRWASYGGRGISVCDRWQVYENFIADMGHPPEGYTLERRDVDGNYEPSNCHWVSADAQYSNKRATVRVMLHGHEFPFRELVAASGIKYATAYARLYDYGWTPERTFPNLRPESLTMPQSHASPSLSEGTNPSDPSKH